MKKQKTKKKLTDVSKTASYIRLISLTKDLTEEEVKKVKNYVSSLKSQRIQ